MSPLAIIENATFTVLRPFEPKNRSHADTGTKAYIARDKKAHAYLL